MEDHKDLGTREKNRLLFPGKRFDVMGLSEETGYISFFNLISIIVLLHFRKRLI